jgi:predicted nuclease of restriction endonuclease-like RecB superfamily
MLTADLAQSWHRNGRTAPRYIDASDSRYLTDAEALINIFDEHMGKERSSLDAALEEYVGTGTDYKILRGLIKLLMDRCTFETATAVEPSEIRRALFLKAREFHPLGRNETARAEVLKEVAAALNCAPADLLAGLYADLPEQQRLIEFESLQARELLDLYNLAQAQALLYRCVEMRLWVKPQAPGNYRELFGAIKAYRLIHTIKGSAASGYEIRLDGPVSMFHRSQKYGIQMAVFLPALLLCANWRMRAEITLKPASGGGSASAFFELDSNQQQLRSHYVPAGAAENPVLEQLSESWAQFDSPWTLERSHRVIDLGESAFVPDFVIRHADGAEFYLEVLGFWTPRYLQERLREFEHYEQKNFLLAAWDELRGSRDALTRIPPHVIVFKRKLEPVAVELAIEKLSDESSVVSGH